MIKLESCYSHVSYFITVKYRRILLLKSLVLGKARGKLKLKGTHFCWIGELFIKLILACFVHGHITEKDWQLISLFKNT